MSRFFNNVPIGQEHGGVCGGHDENDVEPRVVVACA